MPTLLDILPLRKSGRQAIHFTPVEGDLMFCGLPVAGTVRIEGKRDSGEYAIVEFPTPEGRGFNFVKLGDGTDTSETTYDVLCSKNGPEADFCCCKGFTRWSTCKHVDTARTCLMNGWL